MCMLCGFFKVHKPLAELLLSFQPILLTIKLRSYTNKAIFPLD